MKRKQQGEGGREHALTTPTTDEGEATRGRRSEDTLTTPTTDEEEAARGRRKRTH